MPHPSASWKHMELGMGFPARIDSMAKNDILGFPAITISNRLSGAFDELQNRIRERAYHIYLDRGSDQGNSVADWLSAQMELVSPIDLEVKTQKKNIVVEANLKGFASKEVEIEIEGNILKIFGTHAEIDKKENKLSI